MKRQHILMVAVGLAIAGAVALFIPELNPLSANGKAAIGLTIVYTDGTEESVTPSGDWSSYFSPLVIKTSGSDKPVSHIDWTIEVNPVFEGDVVSVGFLEGSAIYIGLDMSTKQSLGSSEFMGDNFVSGEWKVVASGTVSESDLETWVSSDGNHQLNISPVIQMKMTFTDGSTITREASCSALWTFERMPAGSFTSLGIRVGYSPFYMT